MTISTQTFRWSYTATAAASTLFPYTNKILDQDDLTVYVEDVLKTIGTDYTVDGVGSDTGGNVTFLAAPAAGEVVLITKDGVQFTQETDYVENASFPAASHEDALDKLTNITQKIWDYVRRSVKVAITSTLTDLELPTPAAGNLLGWNASVDGLSNYTLADVGALPVTSTGASIVVASSAASALTTLGMSTYFQTLIDDASQSALQSSLGMSDFFKGIIDDASMSALRNSLQLTPYPIYNLKVVPSALSSGLAVYAESSGAAPDTSNPIVIAIPGTNGLNTIRTRSASYLSGGGLFVLADAANYWGKMSLASQQKDAWLYAIWDGTGIVFALAGYAGFHRVTLTTTATDDDYFLLEYGSTYTRDANHFCVAVARIRFTYSVADTPDYTVASGGENAPFTIWAPKSDYTAATAMATTITVAGNIAEDGRASVTLKQTGRYIVTARGSISSNSTNQNGIVRLRYGNNTYANATNAAHGYMNDATTSNVSDLSVSAIISITNGANLNCVHVGVSCASDGNNRSIYGDDTVLRGTSITCVRID